MSSILNYSSIDGFFRRYFATERTGNIANKFIAAGPAKKGALVWPFPTDYNENVFSRFTTPLAGASFRRFIDREGLPDFIFDL